jgi:hypothetical protein
MTYRSAILELVRYLNAQGGRATYMAAKQHIHTFLDAKNPIAAPSVIREAIAGGHVAHTKDLALRATGLAVPCAS